MNTQKQIYTKDKTIKITFRCDDTLSNFVTSRSKIIGLTPSAFVRQMLYQQMYAEKAIIGGVKDAMATPNNASTETAANHANH